MGRVLGSVILIARGRLGFLLGLPWAATAISGLFWIGLVIIWFLPETGGSKLPE
jgi:hypothetical protein